HGVHAVGPQHRLPADERRPGRGDGDPPHAGVQHRHPGGRPRPRRRDLAVPVPAPAAGHDPAAADAAAEAVLMAVAQAMGAPRSHRQKEIRRHALIYLGLLPFLVLAVFPIFWMAVTALKQEPDLYRMDVVPFWFH